MQVRVAPLKLQKGKYQIFGQWETTCHDVLCYQKEPGWKVRQLRTECQKTDKILRTKTEINMRTKISELSFNSTNFKIWRTQASSPSATFYSSYYYQCQRVILRMRKK